MFSGAIVAEAVEYDIPNIPTTLFMSWIVWIIIGVISFSVARRAKLAPNPIQGVFEAAFSFVKGVADDAIGPEAYRYYPLCFGLFIYILVSNMIGLIPGFVSPTSDPNTTFGLAILVFLYYNFEGIKHNGLRYFKQFLGPPLPWYFFPISFLLIITEIMTFFVKPFSLGLRLFCNIFSKELFLAILAVLLLQFLEGPTALDKLFTVAPLVLRPVIVLLGVVIGFIQALVFFILTISYIAGARSAAEHS